MSVVSTQRNSYEGWGKFQDPDKTYFSFIDELEKMNLSSREIIYDFPVFVGHVNIGRYLFLYDLYRQVISLNGHIADLGTYKGASFLFFAKLLKLFEPFNTAQVHGFDWFKGMITTQDNGDVHEAWEGKYVASFETLSKLIESQGLNDVAILYNMDLVHETEAFMSGNRHLRYKMIFLDCGIRNVMDVSLQHFWPRLVRGGILIMDHYNMEHSPDESDLVEKYVGSNMVRQMPFNRQPTAYVVKE